MVQEPPTGTFSEPPLLLPPLLLPPLELELLLPPSGVAVQTPFSQLPLQQSTLVVQVVPMPAVALSGMHEVQSELRSQPVGQVTLQPELDELELHAAKTPAPMPKATTPPSTTCSPNARLFRLMTCLRKWLRGAAG